MSPPKPPQRLPSVLHDRDEYRIKTPPKGHPAAELAIPHHVNEPGTGVVEGDELRDVRERREIPERISHVETRVDGVVKDIGEVKGTVNGIKQMLERDIADRRLERELVAQREEGERRIRAQTETNQLGLERTRLHSRAKIIVALFGLLAAVIGGAVTLLVKGAS